MQGGGGEGGVGGVPKASLLFAIVAQLLTIWQSDRELTSIQYRCLNQKNKKTDKRQISENQIKNDYKNKKSKNK